LGKALPSSTQTLTVLFQDDNETYPCDPDLDEMLDIETDTEREEHVRVRKLYAFKLHMILVLALSYSSIIWMLNLWFLSFSIVLLNPS